MKFIVIGASKGIGLGVAKRAFESGYEIVFFARNKPITDFSYTYHFLDIEINNSVLEFESKLREFSYTKCHYLVCTGGGLSSKNDDFSTDTLKKVWWHNCGFPMHLLLQLRSYASNQSLISFIFSSVATNYKGSVQYSSSKSALEAGFHSMLRESKNENLYLTAIRLAMVDVEHKYFHKLSIESSEIFQNKLINNVPTKYFMKIEAIAEAIIGFARLGPAANGCIVDLSNGSSWT